MKQYRVRITHDAEQDLVDLFDYISRKDSFENADYVLDHLEELILSLQQQPERGHYPPELAIGGVKSFKEVHFKPYRVIYEIIGARVVVLACIDGRRDIQTLLERRLFR